MKILAVDDDPSVLEMLVAALGTLDTYEVVTAASAADGLEILMDDPDVYHAILIDMQMPDMNGIEMCAEVRKLPDYAETPLIIVTAMSQRTFISDAFRAGATDYVTKPFDLIDLRGRVTSAVRQSARSMSARMDNVHELSDAIRLRNITRFLGHDEYENYVMQISQSLASKSSVVAIKIVDVAKLYQTLTPGQFQMAVETVGLAISSLTRQEGHVISYRGNGVFLCIHIGRYEVFPDTFEGLLNKQIFVSKPDALGKHDLRACVGETRVLQSASKAAALDTLKSAVQSADAKSDSYAAQPVISKRVLKNMARSPEEERVERRVYSMLLKDVMRDEFDHVAPGRQSR
ncbi:response regulator transcription factor [Aestuariivita sp.]|jgi:DNA-binding response OmpR family regulator|uniref:response regulator n=1 Tax=Aestuariivita sp. TaxID=1872407 RepID=UPI00216C5629|nr:response regulator transcription factor [Aestuariivita sp.]MCE8008137.1 response regulator transcription factor [Aestuariivita sp.]